MGLFASTVGTLRFQVKGDDKRGCHHVCNVPLMFLVGSVLKFKIPICTKSFFERLLPNRMKLLQCTDVSILNDVGRSDL